MPFHRVILIFLFLLPAFIVEGQETDAIHKKKVDSLIFNATLLSASDAQAAEAMCFEILRYAEENDFLRGKAQAWGTLSTVYNYQGDLAKAIKYAQMSIETFEELGNEILVATLKSNLANLFSSIKDYKSSTVYQKEALDFYLKRGLNRHLAGSYLQLGRDLNQLNHSFEEFTEYINKAETYARNFVRDSLDNPRYVQFNRSILISVLQAKSDAYMEYSEDFDTANLHAAEALNLGKKHSPDDNYTLGYTYSLLSRGNAAKGDLKRALQYNDSALIAYNKQNYLQGILLTNETRKQVLKGLGKDAEALEIANRIISNKDSLFELEKTKEFGRIAAQLETDRIIEEKEVAENEAELANMKRQELTQFLIGSGVIMVFLMLGGMFYVSKQKAKQLKAQLINLDLEKQQTDSELKALKSQMNPHFIFNALNSVQDYIIGNKRHEASEYLGRFADLIRSYLMQSETSSISLVEEVESLEIYLSLEALRFESDFDYKLTMADELKALEIYIPTMLIQPFVENAIAHGLLHKEGLRKLTVSFEKGVNQTIRCVVEDNGVGRTSSGDLQNKARKHQSFSSKAIQERLRLFNKNHETQVGFEIDDLIEGGLPAGTRVTIHLPLIDS